MAKLKLQPEPTFKARVAISQAGGNDVFVEFTFKHRTKDELDAFVEASRGRDDQVTIMEACTGWELTDPWTRESIDLLVANYISSGAAIFHTYIDELTKVRIKN